MSSMYEPLPQNDGYEEIDALQEAQNELRRVTHWQNQRVSGLQEDEVYPILAAIDNEDLIVAEEFMDKGAMSAAQRKACRASILDPKIIKTFTDEEAEAAAKPNNAYKQIVLFMIATFLFSITSSLDEWAVTDRVTGQRHMPWITRMPSLLSYITSVVFSTFSSPLLYGKADLAQLWDPIQIFRYMPVALTYCINDVVAITLVKDIGASAWKVLCQSKLLMTAFGGFLFLGRKQTITQWLILVTSSLSIAAYSVGSIQGMAVKSYFAFVIGICSIILTTAGGLMCEAFLKKERGHFIVQFGRTRICGLIGSVPLLLWEISKNGQWDLFPFGNWTRTTPVLVLSDIIRCWSSTLVVKQLDSVWKTLATALSLNGTYLLNLWMNPRKNKFQIGALVNVLAIATDIMAYAAAKRDEHKMLQIAADAARKEGQA